MAQRKATYTAEDIQVLEYPENIQRRPGMYVGGRGATALHHLAAEVIDNAVDEALVGYCRNISVVIGKGESLTVTDDGRGIPVEIHPEKERSALELAFTELHSGGKFEEGSYSTSGGLHGVGIKATNALSDWLEVTVRRDGVLYRQRYERGLPVTPVQILNPRTEEEIGEIGVRGEKRAIQQHRDRSLGTGTTVSFQANPEFLDVTEFDFGTLARRLQMVAFLVPGLRIQIRDERGRKVQEREFLYKGGLREYIEHLNRHRQVVHQEIISLQGRSEAEGLELELALQWHAEDDEEILSFVNTIPTPDGGRHVAGLQQAITRAINQFAAEKKLLKKEGDRITGADALAGLTAVLHVRLREPQFTSQTKTMLGGENVQGPVYSIVYDGLLSLFRKKMPLARQIIARCAAAARARKAAAQARSLVMRRSVLDVAEESGLPGKLADVAKGTPLEQTTLYIVEGDSAGGSCKQARDRRYHAILPLRGKILNVEGTRLTRVLSNAEVKAIIAAIGAGVGRDFNVEDIRYGRVAILTDSDVDGQHIRTLLYTLFFRLMRPMIEAGRLFVAQAPLYQLRKGDEVRYAYSDAERDRILKQWSKGKGKVTVQRYKGLGEMNPIQLRETVFKLGDGDNPALNEYLLRVRIEDAHAANEAVSLWMGGSAARRRHRLMRYWNKASLAIENGNGGEAGEEEEDEAADGAEE